MTGVITSLPPLVEQPPGNNSSNPAGLPGVTYTAAVPTLAQTWTALQTYLAGTLELAGTGGTSQVVRQSSLNAPLTVSQLTFSDISGSIGPVQLPTPTISTLGGVFSKAAVTHNFLTQIGTDGSITQAQPAFTDISGTIAATQLPNPSSSTLGGVQSAAPVSNQWINSISTSGVPALSQPSFTNISGSVSATQLPNPSASTLGGIQSLAAVGSKWINTISTSGVPSATQPAFTDISGQATLAQLPTIGANTVLGSIAGGTPIALSTTQHTSLVNTFTTSLNGSVPAPTAVASKFLRDDGTWQPVAGAGTVTSVASNGGVAGGTITASGTLSLDPAYSGFAVQNFGLSVSAAASALTVTLTDASGATPSASSPCNINFRNATGTTGSTVARQVTAANSITAASTVTLGTTSATAFRLWVVAFDDAGTVRLGLINCSTATQIFGLDEATPQTSQQIGAGANSAGLFYTAGAAVTAKALRILGYVEWNSSGVATAGTWTTTNLSIVQLFGPGVKKPGDRMQLSTMTTNSTSIFTSSTAAATAVTLSITPRSAANPLRITTTGSGRTQGTATAGQLFLRRGTSTNIQSAYVAGAANLRSTCPMEAFDLPNTASAQSYTVYLASSDNTTGVDYPESPTNPQGGMMIEEIMG